MRASTHSDTFLGEITAILGQKPANHSLLDADCAIALPERHTAAMGGGVEVHHAGIDSDR